MAPDLYNPSTISFLGPVAVGTIYSRCLMAVFAIQAIALGLYLLRRIIRHLHELDDETKRGQAQAAACKDARRNHPKKDVWAN